MRRDLTFTFAVLAATLFAGTALGQNQLGDGRLLDRNLQQGSGGVNPGGGRRNTYGDYQRALVTGNVGGLARFRGDVGYRAPGEFTGSTAADDLYNFRRTTIPTVPVTQFQRQQLNVGRGEVTNPLVNPTGSNAPTLLRPGSGVSAGEITNGYQRLTGSQRSYDATASNTGDLASPSLGAFSQGRRFEGRQELGVMQDDRGELLRVTASPLTGIQRVRGPIMRGELDEAAAEDEANRRPGSPAPRPQLPRADQQRQRDGDEAQGPETEPQAMNRRMRQDDRMLAPSLEIGSRLGEFNAQDDRRVEGSPTFREDALRQQIFQRQGFASMQPGQDVYADLVQRIRGGAPQGEPRAQAAGEQGLGARRQLPQPQIGVAAAPQSQEAAEQGSGLPENRLAGKRVQPAQSEVRRIAEAFEQARQGGNVQQRQAAENLTRQLRYDLPPLNSFAGQATTGFSQILSQAEQKMAQGRYFEAETLYTRALALEPGYPLAEIGRINAQLGAGLLASAGMNLRNTFARHPELIATRYNQPLLPEASRLSQIQEQLKRLISLEDQPNAALAAAYIAYQQQDQAALGEAMTQLLEQSRHDALARLLWHIWLPNEAMPAPAPGTPGTGTPAGGSAPAPGSDRRQNDPAEAPMK